MIIGISGVVLMKLINTSLKATTNVANNVEFEVVNTSVDLLLKSSKHCAGSLRNADNTPIKLIPASLPVATDPDSAVPIHRVILGANAILDLSKPDLGGGMKFAELNVIDAIDDGTETITGVVYKRYLATLRLLVQKAENSMGGDHRKQNFYVPLLAHPTSHEVQRCGSKKLGAGENVQSGFLKVTTPVAGCNANGFGHTGSGSAVNTINFTHAFSNPPAVFLTVYEPNGNGPISCRVTDVTNTNFTFECYPPSNTDCGADGISWMAIAQDGVGGGGAGVPGGIGGLCSGGIAIGDVPPTNCNTHISGGTGRGVGQVCFAFGSTGASTPPGGSCPAGYQLMPTVHTFDHPTCSNVSATYCAEGTGSPPVPSTDLSSAGWIYCKVWPGGMCVKN